MHRSNFVMGCILLVLSSLGMVWLVPSQTIPANSAFDISPSLIPTAACGVIFLLAFALTLRSYRAWRAEPASEEDSDEFHGELTGMGRRETANLLIWTGFAGAAAIGLITVGFNITATVMLAAGMLYAGCRRPILIAVIAVATPLLLSQVVWHALTVRLP